MRRRRAVAALVVLLSFPLSALGQMRTQVVATGFSNPVAFVVDPGDPSTFYVVEQRGTIRTLQHTTVSETLFLDLRASISASGERGLLGLAFPPDAVESRRFYVNFTNLEGHSVVARFSRRADGQVDLNSRFDLRWPDGRRFIEQPFSNHNGGHLAFGPDGYLYVGLGDGGAGNDPDHRAQDPMDLLGKMLRIDVGVLDDHPTGYRIPADNPFAGDGAVTALPEIWSFGLRNPWRYSFDDPVRGGTGALVMGDVGQNRYEEIDYEPRGRGGRNYGWRNREGAHENVTSRPPAFQPLVDPIFEYDRGAGQSVTGGFVYRGRALPASHQGRYFFGDFAAGRVWSIALNINTATGEATASNLVEHTGELGGPGNVSSFGTDADGELYIVSYYTGNILKIIGPPAAPPAPAGLRIIR
jgi:glucose/arabinose dehydrogenase